MFGPPPCKSACVEGSPDEIRRDWGCKPAHGLLKAASGKAAAERALEHDRSAHGKDWWKKLQALHGHDRDVSFPKARAEMLPCCTSEVFEAT